MAKLRKKKGFLPYFRCIQQKCKFCQSNDVVRDKSEGNLVCRSCGRVNSMHNLERAYMDYERTGGPVNPLLGSIGLTTSNLLISHNERSLKNAFKKIDEMCQRGNLVKVYTSKAKEIYKKLWVMKALKGKSNKTFYATCIFLACKLEGSQRTFNEITLISRVNRKDLGKCFKYVKKVLNLNHNLNTIKNISKPSHMVDRFCGNLNLSKGVTKAIRNCCKKIEEFSNSGKIVEFQGKNPDTIASGIIFFVCSLTLEEKRTAKVISDLTGKAPSTIKKCKNQLIKYKKHIISEEFIKENKVI